MAPNSLREHVPTRRRETIVEENVDKIAGESNLNA